MLYALTHPIRTARWWRYRLVYALAERRRAVAALRGDRRARLASAERLRDPAPAMPDRGDVVGRAFIGRDGELTDLTASARHDDRFDPRPPLVPRGADGRHAIW